MWAFPKISVNWFELKWGNCTILEASMLERSDWNTRSNHARLPLCSCWLPCFFPFPRSFPISPSFCRLMSPKILSSHRDTISHYHEQLYACLRSLSSAVPLKECVFISCVLTGVVKYYDVSCLNPTYIPISPPLTPAHLAHIHTSTFFFRLSFFFLFPLLSFFLLSFPSLFFPIFLSPSLFFFPLPFIWPTGT